MKKLILTILCIFSITSTVFAEAAIIWASKKEQIEASSIENIQNKIEPQRNTDTISPSNNIIKNSLISDPLFADYNSICNLFEDSNDYLYIKQSSNIYVKNAWRKVNIKSFENIGAPTYRFNHDYIWVYCQSNGRLLKGSSGKIKICYIDNLPYAFNEYGQMLEGFFNDEGEMWVDNNYSDPFELLNGSNYLYYADITNGVLKQGWLQYLDNTDKYEWKNNIWLYFDPSNHKSIRSNADNKYKLYKVGNKQYAFDYNGVMLTGLDAMKYDLEDNQKIKYFNPDGSIVLNSFVNLDWGDELVEEYFTDYDNYEDISIYLNKSGKLYKDQIKKINSNYYGFDTNGIVLKNCLGIYQNGHYVDSISIEDTNGKEFILNNTYTNKNGNLMVYDGIDSIHYFDKSGKRQTSGKLEFSDEYYNYAGANNGAYENQRNGHYYVHGILMKPIDTKFGIFIQNKEKNSYSTSELYGNRNAFVINSSGKKMNSGAHKDDNDNYWLVSSSGNLIGVYSCKVKNNQYYSTNINDKDAWIPFGTQDRNGRTERNFLVNLYQDNALNFTLTY